MRRLIITLTMLLSVIAVSGRDFQISMPDTLSVEKDESKQARKDSLCHRYGKEFGALLADNKIDLGMSKEMCQVVLDRRCFIIMSTMDENGTRFEEWTFDLEKTVIALADLFEDKQMMLMLMANLEQLSSGAFSKQLQDQVPYKYLKFRNGILVKFLENA